MFLWRNNENYPLIILKYLLYLFHWVLKTEQEHDKANKMTHESSEYSD